MSRRSREPDPTPGLRELHAMVRARLARHDSRYTPGRRRLVEALMSAGRPVTLTEIASSAPDLPVSSTYRNLSVLELSGVVNRISIRGDRAYFELAEPLTVAPPPSGVHCLRRDHRHTSGRRVGGTDRPPSRRRGSSGRLHSPASHSRPARPLLALRSFRRRLDIGRWRYQYNENQPPGAVRR